MCVPLCVCVSRCVRERVINEAAIASALYGAIVVQVFDLEGERE